MDFAAFILQTQEQNRAKPVKGRTDGAAEKTTLNFPTPRHHYFGLRAMIGGSPLYVPSCVEKYCRTFAGV